ncbi:hypothetical protein [Kitasatospora sp. GP82]|uniref:hypothetical protein n=1 Tax=Kitasatospora sp. GP82 TaxID=3035089 RepID=UPI00247721F2|nr:hypothetical protein [Kitasatospora sp. GP82]MDH6125935.1 hypothetical protein [Kitasatospora sp. GP82]
MSYKLTPTWIDVDILGWELEGDVRDCTGLFDEHDQAADDRQAIAWADLTIGTPQQWRRVEEAGGYGWYHYEA